MINKKELLDLTLEQLKAITPIAKEKHAPTGAFADFMLKAYNAHDKIVKDQGVDTFTVGSALKISSALVSGLKFVSKTSILSDCTNIKKAITFIDFAIKTTQYVKIEKEDINLFNVVYGVLCIGDKVATTSYAVKDTAIKVKNKIEQIKNEKTIHVGPEVIFYIDAGLVCAGKAVIDAVDVLEAAAPVAKYFGYAVSDSFVPALFLARGAYNCYNDPSLVNKISVAIPAISLHTSIVGKSASNLSAWSGSLEAIKLELGTKLGKSAIDKASSFVKDGSNILQEMLDTAQQMVQTRSEAVQTLVKNVLGLEDYLEPTNENYTEFVEPILNIVGEDGFIGYGSIYQ